MTTPDTLSVWRPNIIYLGSGEGWDVFTHLAVYKPEKPLVQHRHSIDYSKRLADIHKWAKIPRTEATEGRRVSIVEDGEAIHAVELCAEGRDPVYVDQSTYAMVYQAFPGGGVWGVTHSSWPDTMAFLFPPEGGGCALVGVMVRLLASRFKVVDRKTEENTDGTG